MIELPAPPTSFPAALAAVREEAANWQAEVTSAHDRLHSGGLNAGVRALNNLEHARVPLTTALSDLVKVPGKPTETTNPDATGFLEQAVLLLNGSMTTVANTLNPGIDLAMSIDQARTGIRYLDAVADLTGAANVPR